MSSSLANLLPSAQQGPPIPGSTCAQQPHRSGWIQTMVPGTAVSRDSAQGAEPQSRAFLDFLVLLRGRIHFWGSIKSEKPEDVHWNSINMPEPKCLLFAETRRVSEAFFMWLIDRGLTDHVQTLIVKQVCEHQGLEQLWLYKPLRKSNHCRIRTSEAMFERRAGNDPREDHPRLLF